MTRKGFTLIELLIVMGIIAILAAIAVPRYYEVRERAYVAEMQSDLSELRIAQEAYHMPPQTEYASDLEDLGDTFETSDGVTVTITDAGEDEWSAEAEHDGTDRTCSYSSETRVIDCSASEGKDGAPGK